MATCPECRIRYDDDVADCPKDGETLVPDHIIERLERSEINPGTMIGEYRVEAKIGEGGFGAVYRAIQPVIGKLVAIKLLSQAFSNNAGIVSRFIAEARAVNQIRHKNIVDIFAFGGMEDGRQYFVMELLSGAPLDQKLREKGCFDLDELMPIMRGVLRGLIAAHAAGIAHRDLKPENVFLAVDSDGIVTPKLIDFGIAKLIGADSTDHKTRTGTPIGTPYFMSPEQCRGKNVDHRTDIYSIGAMLHLLLTGTRPFDGDSGMDLLFKQMKDPAPRLSAHRPGFSVELEDLVHRMMAKDASERPSTAALALDLLEKAAKTQKAPPKPAGAPGSAGFATQDTAIGTEPFDRADHDGPSSTAKMPSAVGRGLVRTDAEPVPTINGQTLDGPRSGAATSARGGEARGGLFESSGAIIAGIAALVFVTSFVLYFALRSNDSKTPASSTALVANSQSPIVGSAPSQPAGARSALPSSAPEASSSAPEASSSAAGLSASATSAAALSASATSPAPSVSAVAPKTPASSGPKPPPHLYSTSDLSY